MFSFDELCEIRGFKFLCDKMLELCRNSSEADDLKEILYNGTYNGSILNTKLHCRDNCFLEAERRIGYAYMLLKQRDTFEYLVDNGIFLFHGTNANALPNILKNGLLHVDDLRRENIDILTGEDWSRVGGNRDFISMTNVLEVATYYSMMNGGNFPVIVAISDDVAKKSRVVRAYSDLPEVRLEKSIPLQEIGCKNFLGAK